MAMKVKKITKEDLTEIIISEAKKIKESLEQHKDRPEKVKAQEVNWGKSHLEKKIDHMKALKLEESKLMAQLKKVQELKKKLSEEITKSI